MTITFLGTGTSQGIPVIGSTHPVCMSEDKRDKRLRSSVLLSWDSAHYVIDCGPDFRQQMLQVGCSYIDGILFTHEHADHTAGIDDIRPYFFRQGDIPIYALPRVLENLTKRFDYIMSAENKYPGAPSVQAHALHPERPFKLHNKTVTPILGLHNRIEVLGFRIDNFAYLTDIKTIAESEIAKLHGLEVLVLNALREAPHHSHLNLEEAIELSQKISAKKTYFTHISHLLGFHAEVEKKLPNNVHLAYDFLNISLP